MKPFEFYLDSYKPCLTKLKAFLKAEWEADKVICPPLKYLFKAFELTPLPDVKVVILGQDPYHGPNQANGLCFSVNKGLALPPSLRNIYKELESDCQIPPANHGCLEAWAKQGVLLLNSILSVELGKAASHRDKGWEGFTDSIIQGLGNTSEPPRVFILWGDFAQRKASFIDEKKHLIIRSAHPSPLSAYRGFWGSQPFSKTNAFLQKHYKTSIDWNVN